jgi:flagellar M-ring protein FliF
MPVVDVDRLKEQGRRFVDGFTPGQKAMTILGVIAVVFAGMTFMKWAAKPDYAPLYTGLSSQDAGAVTTALDAQHVKYQITGGGGTIMVPRQAVDKTRIDLSAKNIPAGGDSFVLLDKQGITTDQFTRNIAYQRALQGELAKAIESIDSVAAATVTLTIPQQTVFVGAQEDKPTAAVLVRTTGNTLSADAVNAMVHLVASSIPNMNPDDVTVADANGSVLHPSSRVRARSRRPRRTTLQSRRRSRRWSPGPSAPVTSRPRSRPTST